MHSVLKKAMFLDRDGTLIHNRHYGCNPDEIEVIEGVVTALQLLQKDGYELVVITNQSGVARGYFTEEQLATMHQRLAEIFAAEGVAITAFYHCPHHADGTVAGYSIECDCRKPRPGMIVRACAELGIDPSQSWMIGDILDDVEAGRAAGCRAILIDLGTEAEPQTGRRTPEYVATDLLDAARYILAAASRPTDQEALVG